MSDNTNLPIHVGFVVDGNRRWAKERGLPVHEGHEAGYVQLEEVLLELLRRGTGYVSAFVFSTENWKRSKVEVDILMKLFVRVLTRDVPVFIENNVRVRVIGSRERLSNSLVKAIEDVEDKTSELERKSAYAFDQHITECFKSFRCHLNRGADTDYRR